MSTPDPKRVTRTAQPVSSVPFYLASSMNLVLGLMVAGVAGIFVTCCRVGWFCINFVAETWTPGIVGAYTIVAGGIWGYKRWKQGRDPKSPLPAVTLGPTSGK